MKSEAKSVDAYLEQVPAERKAALTRLRDLCRKTLTGFQEGMEYGMPSYSRNGVVEAGFASQVKYISLYLLKQEVLDTLRPIDRDQRWILFSSLNRCPITQPVEPEY